MAIELWVLDYEDGIDYVKREPTPQEAIEWLSNRLPVEEIGRAAVSYLFNQDESRTLREILIAAVKDSVSDA